MRAVSWDDEGSGQPSHRNRSSNWRAAVEAVANALLAGEDSPADELIDSMDPYWVHVAAVAMLTADARDKARAAAGRIERSTTRLSGTEREIATRIGEVSDAEIDRIHQAIECDIASHARSRPKRRLCVSHIIALPKYVRAAAIEQRRTEIEEREAEFARLRSERMTRLARTIEDWTKDLRQQWTRELLDTKIALPDGTYITWGEFTLAQHRMRLAMFQGQAETALDGAARHQAAIDALTLAGADTLNELVERGQRP